MRNSTVTPNLVNRKTKITLQATRGSVEGVAAFLPPNVAVSILAEAEIPLSHLKIGATVELT
jgi:hypothetical protein